MALDVLGVVFEARDFASGNIARLQNRYQQLDNTVSQTSQNLRRGGLVIAQGLGTIAAGAGLLLPVLSGIKRAGNLEEILLDVKKIAGEKVEIKSLGQEFLKLAPSLGKTAPQLAEIAAEAATLGVSGNENFIMFAQGIAQMSVALDLSEREAAKSMAALQNIFKLPVSSILNIGSSINNLSNVANAVASEIINVTQRAASSAVLLGATVPEVTALSTAILELGTSPEVAGTALRKTFEIAAKDSEKVGKIIGLTGAQFRKSLGEDATGAIMKVATQIASMPNKVDALALASTTFGAGAAKAIISLGQQSERIDFLLGEAKKGFREGTSVTEEFNAKMKGLNAQLNVLGGSWDSLLSTLGLALIPFVTKAVEFISGTLQAITEFIQPYAEFISGTLAFVGAFLIALGTIIALKGAFLLLGAVIKIVGISMAAVGAVFVSAGAILLGLVAIIWVVKRAFETNFGGIADAASDLFNKVSLFFKAVFQTLSSGSISEELYQQLQDAGILGFVEGVLRVFFKLKAFLVGIFDGFMAAWKAIEPAAVVAVQAVMSAFSAIGGAITAIMEAIVSLTGGVDGHGESMKRMGGIGEAIGFTLAQVFTFVADLILGLITAIANVVTSGANMVKTLATIIEGFFDKGKSDGSSFGDKIMSVFNLIKNVVSGVASFISGVFVAAFNIVKSFLSGVFDGFSGSLSEMMPEFQSLGATLMETFNAVSIALGTAFSAIGEVFKAIFGDMNLLGESTGSVGVTFQDLGKIIGKVLGFAVRIIGGFLTLIAKVITGFAKIATFVTGGIGTFAKEVGENGFIDGISNLFSSDDGKGISAPPTKVVDIKSRLPVSNPEGNIKALGKTANAPIQSGQAAVNEMRRMADNLEKGKTSDEPIVAQVTLDGRVLARELNRQNERSRIDAGGMR